MVMYYDYMTWIFWRFLLSVDELYDIIPLRCFEKN